MAAPKFVRIGASGVLEEAEIASAGIPTLLQASERLVVPANTQLLFSEEIDLEDGAELDIDGVLVEVQ